MAALSGSIAKDAGLDCYLGVLMLLSRMFVVRLRFLGSHTVCVFADRCRIHWRCSLRSWLRSIGLGVQSLATLDLRVNQVQTVGRVPRAHVIGIPVLTFSCGSVKELVHQNRRWLDDADGKLRLMHA